MLRRARWLILLAILAIAGTVAAVYLAQKEALRRSPPRVSAPLPANTAASANLWQYEMKAGDRAKLLVRAEHFEQVKNPPVFELRGVEMEIHKLDGSGYDLVKSAHATLNQEAGTMYSDGDVDITMGLSQDPARPAGRILKIHTSGVTLDVRTSKASTPRHAVFEFDQGGGESTGAMYDPSTHELEMQAGVKLDWRGAGLRKPPMHIEASRLLYRELHSDVQLFAPSRLRRGTFSLDAGDSIVFLNPEGLLDRVETRQASGGDQQKTRQVQYSAAFLNLFLTPKGEIRKIEAIDHAQLKSSSASGATKVDANRLDLEFEPGEEESVLKRALATGKGRVESQPAARTGGQAQGPRILTSETIELLMRAGGEEMERVQTHAPGQVEFLPGKKGDPRRVMTGERLNFLYGPKNVLQSAHAVDVKTRTENVDSKGKPVITLTRSKGLRSEFDPKTGQLTVIEQWDQFEYEQGPQRATAEHATLEQPTGLIRLKGKARIWDDTGSTAADGILLDQNSGDMTATGNVSSLRQPDKKETGGGMLSGSEPLNARAAKMTATNRNRKIRYEGDALLWQAASRLRADNVLIDREQKTLDAAGNVVTELPDQQDARQDARQAQGGQAKDRRKASNRYTIVRAPALTYSDKTRLAVYTGGAVLDRPGLNVKSRQLRAWFVQEPKQGGGEETRLDRIFCDGAVEIRETAPDRTRTAQGEHAEYYLAEERMVLNGGNPVVVDSQRGASRGAQITWLSRQDTLVIDNSGAGPAVSRVNQDKKRK
jgi:lipopolysaccharide export system protein LptA